MKTRTIYNRIKYSIYLLVLFSTIHTSATTVSDSNGVWTIDKHQRGIKINFKPDSVKVNCGNIRLVQTLKLSFINAAGLATVYNPADIYFGTPESGFGQMGDDTLADGTVVDHLWCEKDAEYNGDDNKDTPSQGSAAGDSSSTTATKMQDYPFMGDGLFPAGMVKCLMEFEVCAICVDSPFKSFGCIKWKYERTKGSGDWGTSTFVGGPGAQTIKHKNAHTKFKTNHTNSASLAYCPELAALVDSVSKLFEKLRGPFYFRANHTYQVIASSNRVKTGTTPLPSLPSNPIGNSVAPQDYVFIPEGDFLMLRRTSVLPTPDPFFSFPGSFFDVFYGRGEALEIGPFTGLQHTGIRVKNCSGNTLCAAATVNTSNPKPYVLFSVQIDNTNQKVIFRNSAVSSNQIVCKNVLSTASNIFLNPGDSIAYNYPGLLPSCINTLRLKMFIQGYMNSNNSMNPVLFNQGEEAGDGVCDSIDVEIRLPNPPFNVVYSTRAILQQNGQIVCNIPMLNNSYFVSLKHRNALETWSANPIQLMPGETFYDFTNDASKAFGSNQFAVAPGVWSFYSGDLNQDQSIDLLDTPGFENSVNNFTFGYSNDDINGDGSVDLLDYAPLETNINNFVFSNHPN